MHEHSSNDPSDGDLIQAPAATTRGGDRSELVALFGGLGIVAVLIGALGIANSRPHSPMHPAPPAYTVPAPTFTQAPVEPVPGASDPGAPAAPEAPADPKAPYAALASWTMLQFNQAMQSGDFRDFHASLAESVRARTTPAQMAAGFPVLVDPARLAPIAAATPVVDSAGVGTRGKLVVKGHYDTTPSPIHFDLRYAAEDGLWKLEEINVSASTKDSNGPHRQDLSPTPDGGGAIPGLQPLNGPGAPT